MTTLKYNLSVCLSLFLIRFYVLGAWALCPVYLCFQNIAQAMATCRGFRNICLLNKLIVELLKIFCLQLLPNSGAQGNKKEMVSSKQGQDVQDLPVLCLLPRFLLLLKGNLPVFINQTTWGAFICVKITCYFLLRSIIVK